MPASTTLLQFLLILLAGWLQRQQAAVIEYLKAENRALRERLGGRRIIFTDAERRQLAEKARAVGRKGLGELGTIVTPETLLRWHRKLVVQKWTFVERRRPGRPGTGEEPVALVVRMASENPSWGYTRIQGAIRNLDHNISEPGEDWRAIPTPPIVFIVPGQAQPVHAGITRGAAPAPLAPGLRRDVSNNRCVWARSARAAPPTCA